MNKKTYEELINYGLSSGADYSEIYYEEKENLEMELLNNRIEKVGSSFSKGIGIRLIKDENVYYGYTDKLDKKSIYTILDNLKNNINSDIKNEKIILEEKKYKNKSVEYLTSEEKKNILLKVDKMARELDSRVVQVLGKIFESKSKVNVATSLGNLSKENRTRTRFVAEITAEESDKKASTHISFGSLLNKKMINEIDMESEIKKAVNSAITKLSATECIGGLMPVVLGPGFGAVIFHEACGHAMEATTAGKGVSVLSGKIGEKIASSCVTIIDDGTISNLWGTTKMDDEGNPTQKNILIDHGILKTFLTDYVNKDKLKINPNGCARRENYRNAPTSRMNNTYLVPGAYSFDDMIKSIKLGLYASEMNGGCVYPMTGDFNFAVSEAFMIRDGHIAEPVKSVSLIGNTLEILKNVEMVSDNIEHSDGYCGSVSGSIPVTIGQPYVKVSSILVGGSK